MLAGVVYQVCQDTHQQQADEEEKAALNQHSAEVQRSQI